MIKVIDANTREEIITQATKVFAEVGYKEATIRQICKAAKANVCLVSYYFGGKEGLYRAVLDRMAQHRAERAQNLMGNPHSIESKEEYRIRLQMLLEQIFLTQVSRPEEILIMQREILEGMPRMEQTVQQFIKTVRKYFVDFIEYGIRRKFLKKHLDPNLTATSAINLVMAFAHQITAHKKEHLEFFFPGIPVKDLPDRAMKTFIPIFIDGVMNHENIK